MKILYSHYLSSEEHPAARMVGSIAKGLERLGHEVRIHRSAFQEKVKTNGTQSPKGKPGWTQGIKNLVWFLKALARNREFYPRDFQAVKDFQPDLILSRQDAYCYSMVKVALEAGVPLVTYADAPVAYEVRHFENSGRWNPPFLVEWVERYQLKNSRSIITISQGSARILEKYRLEIPIQVIPNGVDSPLGELPTEGEKESRRAKWGIRANRLVGFAGSFKAFHGLALLAKLMESTSMRNDTQWVLVGDGPGLEQFRALGSTWKIPPLITGWIPTSHVREILQMVDVAVAPHAQTKGEFYFCPLKLLDYASAGCAILGSNQGDLPQLLGGSEGGSWIESDDKEVWAKKLNDLLDQPEVTRKMGLTARGRVERGLTWDHTANQIDKVLKLVKGLQS